MVGPEITRRLPYYEGLKFTYHQGASAVTLLGMSVFFNYMKRRPFNSSMLRHLASVGLGLYVGKQLDRFMERKRNQKVMVIEDYICKHPEDFPLVTPRKYKDVVLPWTVVR